VSITKEERIKKKKVVPSPCTREYVCVPKTTIMPPDFSRVIEA